MAGAASMERVQRRRAAGVLKSFFYQSSEKYEVLSSFNTFFRRIIKVQNSYRRRQESKKVKRDLLDYLWDAFVEKN